MKILLVHNYYRSQKPSGENVVYEREKKLLGTSPQIELITYEKSTDEVAMMSSFEKLYLLRNLYFDQKVYDEVFALISKEKPDLVHVHNTFPLITTAVFQAAREQNTPSLQTLHNYRIFCANGACIRNNKACDLCLTSGNHWHGVLHGCYADSRLASIPKVRMIEKYKKERVWLDQIDHFIALSKFAKGKFIQAGIPEDRISLKANFSYDDVELDNTRERTGVLFVGRFSEDKGPQVLLRAARNSGIKTKMIGSGPMFESLKKEYAPNGNISFLGQLSHDQVFVEMDRSAALVLPSLCFEGFPLTIAEAYSRSIPVIASDIGSISELVEEGSTGLKFEADNSTQLSEILKTVEVNRSHFRKMGETAREVYEQSYSAQANLPQMLGIYRKVIQEHQA